VNSSTVSKFPIWQSFNELFGLVFLRHLEYFQGIIFLTSNRADGFDPAMKSRIHLALAFSPPTQQMRRILWKRVLEDVPPEEVGFDVDKALALLQGCQMNGREISNANNTMRNLGREEGGKVTLEHVQTMLQVWAAFDRSHTKRTWLTGVLMTLKERWIG
jgi:AAA+ superfamily predicted ATPase